MTDTANLALPLLQPAQAQKHVTVNEAFARLDALTQITLASRTLAAPPAVVAEGALYAVPFGASGAWAGQAGQLALGLNGGWVFAAPKAGWRAYVTDEAAGAVFDGAVWHAEALSRGSSGAGVAAETREFDQVIGAGATVQTSEVITAGSMVLGVSARVTQAITGTATSWTLGITGAQTQFGSGLGLGAGSYAEGILGSPTTYYSDTPIVLSATGGDFAGGEVRIAIHALRFSLPGL